jgi:recombination protein U
MAGAIMLDAKTARKIFQNAANNASGQAFEGFIKTGCEYYRLNGRAEIGKTPEPFRVSQKHGGGVFTGRFTALAQPDFQGTLKGGRSICFEAKYTTTGKLKFNALTDAQQTALGNHDALGAMAGVCAGIGDSFYFVPWRMWRDMKPWCGRLYTTADDLEPYRVKFTGALLFLDYVHGGAGGQ